MTRQSDDRGRRIAVARRGGRVARAAECAVCVDHAESTFRVEGLCCQHEAELLTRRLGTLRGVERTSTDVVRQRLLVAYDAAVTSRGAIAEAVAETGLRAFPDDESRDVRPAPSGSRVPWLAISAGALATGLAADALGAPRPWWVALLALAVAAGGATTLRRAIASARQGRLDMFVLMTVAVIGAALIGEWIEAATVVVLFALAQALERRSLDRARHAIRTLVADAPADVTRRRGAALERVPIAAIAVGDLLAIGPGERIALDGDVVAGASDVNQAPITGESLPVARAAGDRVFAGTVNGTGALDVRVTAIGDDTTLARIIHLVERAQSTRAPSQAWVDRFAARYTPAVLVLAALVAVVPPLALRRGGRLRALSRAGAAGHRLPVRARAEHADLDRVGAGGGGAARRADQGRPAPRAPRGHRRGGGRQDGHADARRPQRRGRAAHRRRRGEHRARDRGRRGGALAAPGRSRHRRACAARRDGDARGDGGAGDARPRHRGAGRRRRRRARLAASLRGARLAHRRARGAGRRGDGARAAGRPRRARRAGDRPGDARRRAEDARPGRDRRAARGRRPPRRHAQRRSRAGGRRGGARRAASTPSPPGCCRSRRSRSCTTSPRGSGRWRWSATA